MMPTPQPLNIWSGALLKPFVTSRGSENQRKWQPMLHGILWQLLTRQPELTRGIMDLTEKKKTKFHSSKQNSPDDSVQERYEWTAEKLAADVFWKPLLASRAMITATTPPTVMKTIPVPKVSDESCKVLGVSNFSSDSPGPDNKVTRYETHGQNFIEGTKTNENNRDFTAEPIYDSNMVVPGIRETELKRMERVKYKELDRARVMGRFLHRSAKDFLLEPGCLDNLFEDDKVGISPVSARRHGNEHVYILYFAREWLNLPGNVKK